MTTQHQGRQLSTDTIGSELDHFRQEVIAGLLQQQKTIPSKFLYDAYGSELFEHISTIEEYYPTRTEIGILQTHAEEISQLIGKNCLLIEYGSGSGRKIRIVLDALQEPAAYIPIDISETPLQHSAKELVASYPNLEVLPIHADYTQYLELPAPRKPVARRVVFFPGSTIGNFHPEEAQRFLKTVASVCGPGGGLLIGVDMKKDPLLLHRAYNDRQGITASFNLNLLARINRELNANFKLSQFSHYAFYNLARSRIEMHLVSLQQQDVWLHDTKIRFQTGESIWTESSYKYNPDEFAMLAQTAGFELVHIWTDPQHLFSVHYYLHG